MTETSAKKDTQKLQRVIVDALEDVKAQEIVVFDTEEMSALFERVIIASGTSNRQTKALAASVRDKVREAGYPKPRIEGEDNGEWIIVDCGSAVAHIMQPTIRTYYNLEEIWGDKPIRLKLGAPKPTRRDAVPVGPMGSEALKPTRKAPAKSAGKPAFKAASKSASKAPPYSAKLGAKPAAKSASKPVAKPAAKPAAKSSAKAKPKV